MKTKKNSQIVNNQVKNLDKAIALLEEALSLMKKENMPKESVSHTPSHIDMRNMKIR